MPNAPAIFRDASRHPTIVNQDGNMNGPGTPAARGRAISIYCTGLGTVRPQGIEQIVDTPVTVLYQGVELQAQFAGLAPNLPGMYVVNVNLPADLPPALDAPLALRQGGIESPAVE